VRRYFDLYIELLLENGSTEAAFEVSERSRARTMLEALAESGPRSARESTRSFCEDCGTSRQS